MPDPKPKARNDKQEEFNSMMDTYLEERKDTLSDFFKGIFTPPKGKSFGEWLGLE
ncbi:MAG: hypothetical protein KGL39_39455 [Patescibacteria group bacterium]|nr:hypothetical protein [Patescibacteria group bacterium]